MFDPLTLIFAAGAAGALGAGAMSTRAHAELVRMSSPVGDALRGLYQGVVDEGTPAEMRELLDRLDAGEGGEA
ncbi:MAG TPA: NepR family anti-sigma factor [Allosphingosinicella sp.]|jgi:hypothetical protein